MYNWLVYRILNLHRSMFSVYRVQGFDSDGFAAVAILSFRHKSSTRCQCRLLWQLV